MAGPYGSVGVDYRELQAPEQVNTDLPNNEAALRAEELGGLFKEFEGISSDVENRAQTTAGALAGAASGATGHPQYREGLRRFTAYSQAFNNAATGAYAVEAEAQADDAAARLRVQANNNPDTFRTTFSAVRDGVLKNAPAEAVPILTELYNRHLAEGLAAISGDQAAEQKELQKQTYLLGVQRQTSRVAILQGSANPQDQLRAMDEQTKLSLLIDGGVNSGLYDRAEAQAMHINAARTVTAQVFQTQVDRELADPNGDPVGLLERFRKAHEANLANKNEAPILSEDEYQKLMADATTKIREWNLTQALARRDGKTAEQARFEAGDAYYTSQLLEEKLTEQALDEGVRTQNLKPETARTLRAALISNASAAPAKSSPADLYRLLHDPNFLDLTGQDIATYPGTISTQDRLAAVRQQQQRLDSWENTQNVKLAKGSIAAALKITPGTPAAMLSDAQRRAYTEATQEFLTTMQNTDPAKRDGSAASVAQTVIKHIQQREAAADVLQYQQYLQTFTKQYGPGGSEPMDSKDYQQRLQHYQDLIKQAQQAARGD